MLKRPTIFIIIAFMIGIIFQNIKRTILIYMVLLFFVFLFIYFFNLKKKCKNKNLPITLKYYKVEKYIQIFIYMWLFCIAGCIYTNHYLNTRLKDKSENINIIQGTVLESEDKGNYRENIIGKLKIDGNKSYGRVILKSQNVYKTGDIIRAEVIASIPEQERNEGGFNYRKYLYSKGIYLICVETYGKITGKENFDLLSSTSFKIKQSIKRKIKENYPIEESKILNAILLGEKGEIEDEINTHYEKAGMIHLLVVSGAHIAFLIGLIMYIFKFLHIPKNISNIILCVVIVIYMIITGLSKSVLRAGIVSIILLISGMLKRQNDTLTTMFLVAFILLFNNPYTIYSVGFLLSFSGALSIVLLNRAIYEKLTILPEFLRKTVSVTLSAQIFTTPIIIYVFNTLYLSGVFSNIPAVPLTSAILTLGLLSCIPVAGIFIAYANSVLILILSKTAEFFSNINFLTIRIANRGFFYIIIYYFYVFIIFKIIKLKRKTILIITAILVSIICFKLTIPGKLQINFIDVGHGDSIFIITPSGKTILIDTGDKYISNDKEYDTGKSTVVPYILKKGYKKIDLLILTHMDNDHIGGAEAVLNNLNVENAAIGVNSTFNESYKDVENMLIKKNVNIVILESEMSFSIDNIKFIVLTPFKELNSSENNNSVTFKMSSEKINILFMGDLEKEGEEILLSRNIDLNADIIKIGHHGSNTSTTKEFLSTVNPKTAVISVGNRFMSLPSSEVLQRLEKNNIEILRTDELGGITLEF